MSLKQYSVKATVDKVTTYEDIKLCKGAYGYELAFEFIGDIWDSSFKKAVFDGVQVDIVDNKCVIPIEATAETGSVKLGVYGYEAAEGGTLIMRVSPYPTKIKVVSGSYDEYLVDTGGGETDTAILEEIEQLIDESGVIEYDSNFQS